MKKRLVLLAKLLVMTGLLAVLYRHVDFAAFRAALAGLKWGWLPLIYALFFLNTTLSSWKWQMLLRADGVRVPLGSLLASYLIGSFFNLFLPSSIGGDSYRVVDASRHGGAAKSFASVFADRLTGFLALAIWAVIGWIDGWILPLIPSYYQPDAMIRRWFGPDYEFPVRGVGVLVYAPFGRTRLWERVRGQALPAWAAEFDAHSWAQFFLKFVLAHPAVTVATPATSKARHMIDNLGGALGALPDADLRRRMIGLVEGL